MDLKLPNIGKSTAKEVVYDPTSQQIVMANSATAQTYSMSMNDVTAQHYLVQEDQLDSNFAQKKNENAQPPLNANCLRFTPGNAQSNLHISSSGLLLTSLTKDEEIAVANIVSVLASITGR